MPKEWPQWPEFPQKLLVGPRPIPPGSAFYYPTAEFEPVQVEELRSAIWYNKRRMVQMDILPDPEYSMLVTLFLPFAPPDEVPTMFFETILFTGPRGWLISRAASVKEARLNHIEALKVIFDELDLDKELLERQINKVASLL